MHRIKLTDIQKKKIVADYISNGNYSETARMNGNISPNTVKKIVKEDEEFANKCEQKKEENIKDILDYMDSIAEDQKEIINLSLQAMKKKLKNPDAFTNVKDIATVYGVIYDKALKSKEIKMKQGENNSTKKVMIVNDLPRK